MIGGGAGLSLLAGASLDWGSGSLPLLIIMATTMNLSLLSIIYVLVRERQLGDTN